MKARLSESASGLSLVNSRQEKVALPLPTMSSTVCAIMLNGRAVPSSLTSPRLTPASPVSSAPVSPRIEGSPAMISIKGAADSNWPVSWSSSATGKEQQAVLFEEFAGTERLKRLKMLGIPAQPLFKRRRRRARQFRRRRLDDGKDGAVPVESLVELLVALAPVQIGRDQRVDVGIDGEMMCCVETSPHRQAERDEHGDNGEARAGPHDRDNDTCQHNFSF